MIVLKSFDVFPFFRRHRNAWFKRWIRKQQEEFFPHPFPYGFTLIREKKHLAPYGLNQLNVTLHREQRKIQKVNENVATGFYVNSSIDRDHEKSKIGFSTAMRISVESFDSRQIETATNIIGR